MNNNEKRWMVCTDRDECIATFMTEQECIDFCDAYNWELWNGGFRYRLEYWHY